ncbi:MAG: serine hydrolase [Acidobacteria bacterium]|nr:serine hydrolase [Acidobacteriota bacterium]
MRFVLLPLCLFLVASVGVQSLEAQQEHWAIVRAKTEAQLQEIVKGVKGVMGLVAVDLTTGERFGLNENLVFPQASAIKIPILMEVYKQAAEGEFKLSDSLPVTKQQQVGGSGVLKELGDGTSHLSIRDLAVLMILVSDNTATNILIDLVGMENISQTMASLGLAQTKVQRRMMDIAARARGDENLSTPAEAARIMEILYRGEFLDRAACDDILDILKKTKPEGRYALPRYPEVAFKTGGIPGVATEWAIVYLEDRPYITVVMENYAVGDEASKAFKELLRTVYDYFWRLSRATRYGTYVE